MSRENSPLPPAQNDEVVEVSLRHAMYAFGGLILGTLLVGTGITIVRDWVKLKRQKALIEAATRLLFYFKEGDIAWKEETTGSLSPRNKSNE